MTSRHPPGARPPPCLYAPACYDAESVPGGAALQRWTTISAGPRSTTTGCRGPGKLAIEPTKRMATQRDLALAYSPGVAAACEAIVADPDTAHDYTARGNLVAVISNGTAVLGLGNIGALAGKPVMEGKAVLFKKFAGIDVFDIEVDAEDPDRFCDVVAALEPTFGAINLEDIKAPECFAIEAELRQRMRIPVFHDDQHGTAITVAAAIRNGWCCKASSCRTCGW